jgi:hypothetical protein
MQEQQFENFGACREVKFHRARSLKRSPFGQVLPATSAPGQSRHFGRRQTTSGLPPEADIVTAGRYVSKVPIVLQKSFCGRGLKFSEP